MKNITWKGLMKISRTVYELEPLKDFILASEAKVDLGGQSSYLSISAKLAYCAQNLVKLLSAVFELFLYFPK